MSVLFVTGGSRGIGAAIAARFKREGWKVAACATKLDGFEKGQVDLALKCDVGDESDVRRAVRETVEKLGRIDVVVNNAGVSGTNDISPDAGNETWHRIVEVNLDGTYFVCKQVAARLPDRTGRIINIASVLGLLGVADASAYCAAKHGVVGLTKSLALKLAPRGITVNAICPGWVKTDMAESRWRELGVTEAQIARRLPLGRVVLPEEVAELAWYLGSAQAGAITGQALVIDSGQLLL